MSASLSSYSSCVQELANATQNNLQLAIDAFNRLVKFHQQGAAVLEFEMGEITRRTVKNNNRKLRFYTAKTATAATGVGVVVASHGTLVLAVGGYMLAGNLNRWRRECQYNEKVNKSLENINKHVLKEVELIAVCAEAIACANDMYQKLCDELNSLSNGVATQNLICSLPLSCPLLAHYFKKVAPDIVGQAAIYTIQENPVACFNLVSTALPGMISILEYVGVDNAANALIVGIEALPFIGAAFMLAVSANQRSNAVRDSKTGADEIVAPIRDILAKQIEILHALRAMLL